MVLKTVGDMMQMNQCNSFGRRVIMVAATTLLLAGVLVMSNKRSGSTPSIITNESVISASFMRPQVQYSGDIQAARIDARRRSRRVCDSAKSLDEAIQAIGDFATTRSRSQSVMLEGVAGIDGSGFVRVGGVGEARYVSLSGVFDWREADVGKIVFIEGELFRVRYGTNVVHVDPIDRLKKNNMRGGPSNTVVNYIAPHSVTIIDP